MCRVTGGILIAKCLGISKSQFGVVLVVGTQRYSSVSDNNNFVAEQSLGSGYRYRAYGELSHFVYCILQKIKKSESLPLVEKWEDYMLPTHSSFAAIDEEHITTPEDAMKIDLVPGLPPSGGYENIVTAMDIFSRYLFAYPTSNQDATTIAKVIINILTKHAYLPTTLISDKSTAFTSHVIKEVAGVLGITLKHATTKHAQTIGLLDRSHASIKQSLKIETGERRSLWHKYISIAVLNYNTSYHSSIGCEPSREFHGRILYNILDLKLGFRPQKIPAPDSEIAQDVLQQTETIFQDVRRNAMQAYIKYKAYFAAPYCQPWPPDQNWVRELAVSALKSSLGAMTIPPFSFMDSYWLGLSRMVGRRGPTLRLAKPSSSLLSGSSASWNVIPQGSVLM